MRQNAKITALLALVGAPPLALGAGVIHQFDSGGTEIGNGTGFTSTTDLPLSLDTSTRYVDIIPSSDTDDIPFLTFTGGPSDGRVRFYLGGCVALKWAV